MILHFPRALRIPPAALALLAFGLPPAASHAADPAPPADTGPAWKSLFDGRALGGWKKSGFDDEGAVKVESPFRDGPGAIVMEPGAFLTGITWTREDELPRVNYEISLEAMKLAGHDFFCALTFPVRDTACTLIVGGWGGMVVGLSSVDDMDASENETTGAMEFVPNRWYRIRLRVTSEKIEAWIDNRHFVELETKDRKIGLRWGDIDLSLPLGIAAYQTRAAVRDIKLRRL